MTAHFLPPDGSIAHRYAAAIPLRVRHTGPLQLRPFLMTASIREKVHMLIRDNGSSMVSAMEIAGIDSEGWFAHIVQNVGTLSYIWSLRKTGFQVIKDGLKVLGSLIHEDGIVDRVKKVIRKLHKSNVERERSILKCPNKSVPKWKCPNEKAQLLVPNCCTLVFVNRTTGHFLFGHPSILGTLSDGQHFYLGTFPGGHFHCVLVIISCSKYFSRCYGQCSVTRVDVHMARLRKHPQI